MSYFLFKASGPHCSCAKHLSSTVIYLFGFLKVCSKSGNKLLQLSKLFSDRSELKIV